VSDSLVAIIAEVPDRRRKTRRTLRLPEGDRIPAHRTPIDPNYGTLDSNSVSV
jgi:hypothetical protein